MRLAHINIRATVCILYVILRILCGYVLYRELAFSIVVQLFHYEHHGIGIYITIIVLLYQIEYTRVT